MQFETKFVYGSLRETVFNLIRVPVARKTAGIVKTDKVKNLTAFYESNQTL